MDKAERERLREQTESVVIAAYPSAASWSNDTPYGVTRQPVSEDRRVAVDRLLVLALLDALDAAEARERALRQVIMAASNSLEEIAAVIALHGARIQPGPILSIVGHLRAALAADS